MEIILGMVMWFSETVPVNFAEANGQCLSVQHNAALYSVMSK